MHRRQFVAASAALAAWTVVGHEAQALARARHALQQFARVGITCIAPPLADEFGPARLVVDGLLTTLEKHADRGPERVRAVVEQAVRYDLAAGRWSPVGESQIPQTLRALQILAWTAQHPSTLSGSVI